MVGPGRQPPIPPAAGRGHSRPNSADNGNGNGNGRGRGRGRGRGNNKGRGRGRGGKPKNNGTRTPRNNNNDASSLSLSSIGGVVGEVSAVAAATTTTAVRPSTSTPFGDASVTNSFNEFANQMQTIHQVIGGGSGATTNSMQSSSSRSKNKKQSSCPTCIKTSTKLQRLQTQTKAGLQSLEKMTRALEQLVSEARIAQSTLEQIQLQLELDVSGNGSGSGNVSGNVSAIIIQEQEQTMQSASAPASVQSSSSRPTKTKESSIRTNNNNNANVRVASIQQTSSSASNIKHDNAAETTKSCFTSSSLESSKVIVESIATSTSSGSQPPQLTSSSPSSLELVISSRSQYLTTSPAEYAAWLRSELDIETAADLAEAVEDDCLGGIGIKAGLEGAFCRAIVQQVAMMDSANNGSTKKPKSVIIVEDDVNGGSQPKPPPQRTSSSLEYVISCQSQYLTTSPAVYANWLRAELDIETAADLAEAAKDDCLINEGIKAGLRETFNRAIVQQVAMMDANSTKKPKSVQTVNGAKDKKDFGRKDDERKKVRCFLGSPMDGDGGMKEGGDSITLRNVPNDVSSAPRPKNAYHASAASMPGKRSGNAGVERRGTGTGVEWFCRACTSTNPEQSSSCFVCGWAPKAPLDKTKDDEQNMMMMLEEQAERERVERERVDRARVEQERVDRARVERERMEQERLEQERLEREQLEQMRMELERMMERERLDQERIERARMEQARIRQEQEKAWAEQKRVLAQQAEAQRLEKERIAAEQARAHEAEAKRLEEEKEAKKQAKKEAREARAAAKAKQKAEERLEAEAEKQRQLEAKRNKQATMEQYKTNNAKANTATPMLSPAAQTFQPKASAGLVSIGATSGSHQVKSINSNENKNAPKTAANKSTTAPNITQRLSHYIKRKSETSEHHVSPIFDLLQNEKTLQLGRDLIQLECEAKKKSNDIDGLERQRGVDETLLKKITSEEDTFKDLWPGKAKEFKLKIQLVKKRAEDVNNKSPKDKEKEEEFEDKRRLRAYAIRQADRGIEQIEKEISSKAHVQIIEKLKNSAIELNAVQAEIEALPKNILNSWKLSKLQENARLYEKDLHTHIGELEIDTYAEEWNLGSQGDKIAKKMKAATKRLNSFQLTIKELKSKIGNKREMLGDIGHDRLNLLTHISAEEKKLVDENKWSNKEKKMYETIDALNKEVENLTDDDTGNDHKKLLKNCIIMIEKLAGDDRKMWPGKAKKMWETIDALKKQAESLNNNKSATESEVSNQTGRELAEPLLNLIKDIEDRIQDGTKIVEKYKLREAGDIAATLETMELEIKEVNNAMQETVKQERNAILAFFSRNFWKDERMKLESRKKHLIEQIKICRDIISSLKEKRNIDERREVMNEEVVKGQDELRQLEKAIVDLETGVFTEVRELSKVVDKIDWEAAFKPRLIALYSKSRVLREQLEKDKSEDKRLVQEWQRSLEARGLDDKSKEQKCQAAEREIASIEREIASGDQRVQDKGRKIKEQKEVVEANYPRITAATTQLDVLQIKIEKIRGFNPTEDNSFDIDNSKDSRGHTFLMVAAQNNDFETAKLCLNMGANTSCVNPDGLTAIDYCYFFGFDQVTNIIVQNRGSLPKSQADTWDCLKFTSQISVETSINWDEAMKIADSAAVPAETLMECPEACEEDENRRMSVLSNEDRCRMDFTCFEARLLQQSINSDQVRRVVLLDKEVYNWCLMSDATTTSNFIDVLEGLKPAGTRGDGVKATQVHRRAIVGTAITFEVLAAAFLESTRCEKVVLFTPFVSGEVEGVAQIGVLVWAVCSDSEASMYKTLVSNTEFMRHKVNMDDRFLPHQNLTLELGRDMHLLDLHSTSIWTTSTMDLFILNVDEGDLGRINDPGFSAKKRIVYSEEIVNKAIFRADEAEAKDDEGILATGRVDMSTVISGGAGTGKTLLMIKKVVQEDPSRRILMVSRLPRLVNIVKAAVDEKRDDGVENVTFTTYDELFQLLARRVVPDDDSDYKSFVRFDHVRYECDEDSGVSFFKKFIHNYLSGKARKQMLDSSVEPLILWSAIIIIKSHAICVASKKPLTLDQYLSLPPSFGLIESQRQLCYGFFTKYEDWREHGSYWDEADRSMYLLTHGPSVFRDEKFVPWAKRVNRWGEVGLLGEDGNPLHPFFTDMVCVDEAQDFTEVDIAVFIRMCNLRSVFINTDPAQSVESGISMREGTVNDVFYSQISQKGTGVKDVLQAISLKTNHRTHASNLAMGIAVRRILARSFKIPIAEERALINGTLPKTLRIKKLGDLADGNTFRGGNIVFVAPDEKVHDIRNEFRERGVQNDVFGVREAKGLEFDSVALVGFFSYIEGRGSSDQWQNALRWLFSTSGITTTCPTGEKIAGVMLEDCDYAVTNPEVSDEAMLLYTALTRARNQLFLIETDISHSGKSKKNKGVSLADFAFRMLSDLELAKAVSSIDEGQTEMTPAQHKARGILLVTQALSMIAAHEPFDIVRKKFLEAEARFVPSTGNDIDLLKKCKRHMKALEIKRDLMRYAKTNFFVKGAYNLEDRFAEVLHFGQKLSDFFSKFSGDSFLEEEVKDVESLVEEIFAGTPYEFRFRDVYQTM